MKKVYKTLTFLVVLVFLGLPGLAQNAWINEIHYDNDGTDVGEFIEVVIENAGSYNLADFSVVLYNGSGGASYNTKTLDLFTSGAVVNGFSIFYYTYPSNGIQNGPPDGMALAYQGTLVPGQWLSYEGAFVAADGPAAGLTSVDIGVSEPGTTPIGQSLQLSGTGTQYGDFIWQPPAAETPGQANNSQTFSGSPLPEPSNYPTNFASYVYKISVTLTWTDATGAQLPAAYLILIKDENTITPPVDGVPVANDLDLSDGMGALNVNYGMETCMFYPMEGETEYFFEIYPYTNAGANIDYKTDGTAPSTSATTDPLIHLEQFETGDLGSWTQYSVASDKDWGAVSFGGAYNTTWFAQMNGFNENEPSNDWLISPSLNLDVYGNEILEFFTQWRYGSTDDELKLKYSTDYTSGDPTAATWTELSFNKSPDQDIWYSSGDVSLASISGSNVHIAFQYLSSGNPRRWGVDEILITGGAIVPYINIFTPMAGDFWEQGTSHDITWEASNTAENVMIELTTNASAGSPTWEVLNPSVPAAQGTWTWNISPTQPTSDDCQIRITDLIGETAGLSAIFSIIEPIYIPQLVITEIMYNPPESGTDSLEFIEVYNHDNIAVDLTGYYFSDGVTFHFPSMTLNPGEYFVVAVDSLIFLDFFGVTAYEFAGGLSNSGELITIRNSFGMLIDSVMYDDQAPWPTEPDGLGPSLRFCDPGLDNSIADFWGVSIEFAGLNANGDTIWASPGAGCANWPVADFEADVTMILAGESVQYTDLSGGDPDTWVWTFIGGDPASYVGQTPPAIIYDTPGTYNVALYVENVAGSSTKLIEDYITVGVPPIADFVASTTNLFAGETVDFTDLSSSAETWEWTFEGGTPATSTEQNPMDILYETSGIYDVTLVVTNMFGTDTLTMEDYIDVLPVGIGEQESNVMQIYPNPSKGLFNLNNTSGGTMQLTITSLLGQRVLETEISSGLKTIDISGYGDGIYFIHVWNEKGDVSSTQRIVVY